MVQNDKNNTRSRAVLDAATDHPPATDDVVDALQRVIVQMDSFLTVWLQRLDENITVTPAGPDSETTGAQARLRECMQEFQQEKTRWEAQRSREAQQIEENCEQLTQAWLRLEEERRLLLQAAKVSESHRDLRRTSSFVNDSNGGGRMSAGVPVSNDQPSSQPSLPSNTNQTQQSAVRQFQRLRQQIAASRPSSSIR